MASKETVSLRDIILHCLIIIRIRETISNLVGNNPDKLIHSFVVFYTRNAFKAINFFQAAFSKTNIFCGLPYSMQ